MILFVRLDQGRLITCVFLSTAPQDQGHLLPTKQWVGGYFWEGVGISKEKNAIRWLENPPFEGIFSIGKGKFPASRVSLPEGRN